jgi:hypothetical protein
MFPTTKQRKLAKLKILERGIRQRMDEIWAQFTIEELQAFIEGDKDAVEKFERLGGHKFFALYQIIMTPEERREQEKEIKEMLLEQKGEKNEKRED